MSTLTIIEHLYDTYGQITDMSLSVNNERMREPYDGSIPIEHFFHQIQTSRIYAKKSESPYEETHMVAIDFYVIQKSSLFPQESREWRQAASTAKTCKTFEEFFAKEYREWKEFSLPTAEESGYTVEMTEVKKMHSSTVQDRTKVT